MEDGKESNKKRSTEEIRAAKTEEVKKIFPWMEGIEKDNEIEIRTFKSLDSEQITEAYLINFLEIREKAKRENANRLMTEHNGTSTAEDAYQEWSDVFDALNGARGNEPVSKTIDYFRKQASYQRSLADGLYKQLNNPEPISIPQGLTFLSPEVISQSQKQDVLNELGQVTLLEQEKAAKNYDTAARIFENRVNFQVAETPTEGNS
jgi:hypothetical protein